MKESVIVSYARKCSVYFSRIGWGMVDGMWVGKRFPQYTQKG